MGEGAQSFRDPSRHTVLSALLSVHQLRSVFSINLLVRGVFFVFCFFFCFLMEVSLQAQLSTSLALSD